MVAAVKMKTLKHSENLLKVSNEIKQYMKNTVVKACVRYFLSIFYF